MAVEEGIIATTPALSKDNWLHYGLMEYLKMNVKKEVEKFLETKDVLCDKLDVEYQVLFRLTSFGIEEIFEDGDKLSTYCEDNTRGIGWRGLLSLDENAYKHLKINKALLLVIIEEQLSIILMRLSKSSLPIETILRKTGIFAEDGWHIRKYDNNIFVIKIDAEGKTIETKKVYFKEVRKEIATRFHNDLHYIHTARCDRAFGFFLEDEPLPFSVLSIEKVDRSYKRNTLLLFGYDPRHCVEFTRLYSKPGVPKNTSSAIFGEMFSYLKQNEPRIEAAISAFMPTYATGLSMLTGGFEFPILLKAGIHYFSPTNIKGKPVMEHVTNRRQDRLTTTTQSKFPLLPVIELISPMREPRFDPVLTLGRHMIEL